MTFFHVWNDFYCMRSTYYRLRKRTTLNMGIAMGYNPHSPIKWNVLVLNKTIILSLHRPRTVCVYLRSPIMARATQKASYDLAGTADIRFETDVTLSLFVALHYLKFLHLYATCGDKLLEMSFHCSHLGLNSAFPVLRSTQWFVPTSDQPMNRPEYKLHRFKPISCLKP